ncbi:MAG: ATP-binding cassette domain-containing protein [Luminiphilus sp.]|nr:ATP-binding cassette domain-containing protein [Luminiphilus sp.]|tara:strand:+ start:1049 stop:1729 length:681 start_codon:yes stop_codon:yes gene_type:complete
MSDRAVLEAVELGKTYRDARREIVVLDGLALSVAAGEWLAIVGASGAGKSTLLNLLGGLDTPSTGEVSVAGQSLSRMSENERSQWRNQRLGFVFQMHHLLPEFTALESVAMPARIGGAPKQEAEAKAKALLEQLGLAERLSHRPAALSGGERQRVAIARALVNEPACVLMDEPTGNLDPDTAEQVLAAMSELRDRDTAFVVVTHDPAIAQRMDRQLTLANGRLEAR